MGRSWEGHTSHSTHYSLPLVSPITSVRFRPYVNRTKTISKHWKTVHCSTFVRRAVAMRSSHFLFSYLDTFVICIQVHFLWCTDIRAKLSRETCFILFGQFGWSVDQDLRNIGSAFGANYHNWAELFKSRHRFLMTTVSRAVDPHLLGKRLLLNFQKSTRYILKRWRSARDAFRELELPLGFSAWLENSQTYEELSLPAEAVGLFISNSSKRIMIYLLWIV